jgi:hypothetical protein
MAHDVKTNVIADDALFSSLDPKIHTMYIHRLASVAVRKL